jgi:acylphosphatase
MHNQIHILISGDVHGVGFRQFVRHWARKIGGINGWVRNLDDGRVEVVMQGDQKKADQLIRLIKKGPPLSNVKNVTMQNEEMSEEYRDFIVLK